MSQRKNNIQIAADNLSRYIRVFAYISLYPALIIFINSWLNIDLNQIFHFNSDVVYAVFWFLSLMFIPAVLWLAITKIFKNTPPTVSIVYFYLFVAWQFLIFLFMLFFWLVLE